MGGNDETKRKRALFSTRYVPRERRGSLILACVFFWSLLLFEGISRYVYGSIEVVGSSMYPNLRDGERHLINRWLYLVYPPQRGDVVVIRDPETGGESVKRIIGLPGERLQIREDGIWIDGLRLKESYNAVPDPLAFRPVRIPQDHYFVVGDNRPVSADSRSYGPIARNAILGSVEMFALGDS